MKILICTLLFIHVVAFCSGWGWGGKVSEFLHRRISKKIKIIDGGFIFKFWKDADVPIYMLVRFFNVTNPESVLKGDKPILKEVGPYVYQQKRENEVEEFGFENRTVSYRTRTTYFFRSDFSQGTEDDIITTLNIPYIVMVEKASNLSNMEKYVMREIFTGNEERLFMSKSVSELLFEGYVQKSIAEVSALTGDEFLPNNTFGLFYGKNESLSDLLEIYTGVGNESLFGQTRSWEHQTELTFWDDKYCNMINGSDGAIFSPWLTRDSVLKIFAPDMCRSLYLVYDKDVRVTGIPGYKFIIPKEVLESPDKNPENECYCRGEEFGPCLKTGAMRLAPCRNGTNVVISWPHFYNGDETYVNQSIGLSPNATLHEAFVILEPFTGLIRRGSKRFQINIDLKPNRQFKDMKRIPNMLFPIAWIEESKLSRFRTRAYFASANSQEESKKESCQHVHPIVQSHIEPILIGAALGR